MRTKYLLSCLFILSIILSSVYLASALTATVGNARMVLRMEVGETLERSILIRNVNDVPVTIELSVAGELADGIDLNEDSFDLAPGEEKKAYFTVSPEEEATTNSKINIKFIPEEGNAVGFSSAIIVIAGEGGEPTPIEDEDTTDNTQDDTTNQVSEDEAQNSEKTTSGIKIGSTSVKPLSTSSFSLTPPLILGTSTLLLAVILLGLLIYSFKVKKEVKRGRGRKSA